MGPRFDEPVAPSGYAWWYIDAISDDGRNGLTLIAFVGSVFSPYYAWARRRGSADPLNHCALNVALYGERSKLWTLTERGRGAVHRTASSLTIGSSALLWNKDALTIAIDEISAPIPRRVRGIVRIHPQAFTGAAFAIDANGRHRWHPVAPRARIQVTLEKPSVRWLGTAYLDANAGDEPIEDAFTRWHWSRAHVPDGTIVLYDVERRDGSHGALAKRIDPRGAIADAPAWPVAPLPKTGWRIPRETRSDAGSAATIVRTLEDAPFYARSLVANRLGGTPVVMMHESLSLERLRRPLVKLMLPFRMPRVRGKDS